MAKFNTKSIILTSVFTIFIFVFISLLIYSIYCYGYYDKYQEELYTEIFNKKDYNYVYDYIIKDESLSKTDYENAIYIMLNQTEIERIYNEYYKDIYSKDEFLNKFFFGNPNVTTKDIKFSSTGKTTYFKKRKLYYEYINLHNGEETTKLGVISNISFTINDNTKLYLDDNLLCDNTLCQVDKIYGGIHSIIYIKDNIKYYALINITEDNQIIDIEKLDNLVNIGLDKEEDEVHAIELKMGNYELTECYMAAYCPHKIISNLTLSSDNTCELFLDISITQAKDYYKGTYTINNNILELNFSSHTFSAMDYDNGHYSTYEITTPTTITFKMLDSENIINGDYKFKFNK